MSLGEHLLELRNRLFVAAIAIVLVTVVGFFFAKDIIDALRVPIDQIALSQDREAELIYTTVTGSFDLRFQIALTIGILGASPVWLYELFAFLVPGLNKKEKRYTFGFFFVAVPLFIGGAFAGWFVFPHMVELLSTFSSPEDPTLLEARAYYDFVIKLVLAVGVGFVLPVFLVLLNFVGVLSAKSILKGWRVAILLIATFCAIATPAADVISMFLLAVPMVALYFAGASVAWLHDRRVTRRIDQVDAELAAGNA
jgi:sec-independent protein translocase protein TatC